MAQSDKYPETDDDASDWQKFGPRPLLSRISMELTLGWGVSSVTIPNGLLLSAITTIDVDNGDDPWPD